MITRISIEWRKISNPSISNRCSRKDTIAILTTTTRKYGAMRQTKTKAKAKTKIFIRNKSKTTTTQEKEKKHTNEIEKHIASILLTKEKKP